MMKNFEIGSKVWCLYVNLTNFYVSFKIEEGKFLGEIKQNVSEKKVYVVEHTDEDVNYLQIEDIHGSENDALKALQEIITNKLNNEAMGKIHNDKKD